MSALPHWWGNDKKTQNARSKRQEARRAAEVGGRPRPGSGSSWRAPQDVVSPEALEQVKYTDKGSFTLRVAEWQQVCQDAALAGREPSMLIEFASHGVRVVISAAPDVIQSA